MWNEGGAGLVSIWCCYAPAGRASVAGLLTREDVVTATLF